MNYYKMYNLYLNGRITSTEWYNYCTEYLFNNSMFVAVCRRLKYR